MKTKASPRACYTIRRAYRSVMIYLFNEKTKEIQVLITGRPNKELPKKERYDQICKQLAISKIPLPEYDPKQ